MKRNVVIHLATAICICTASAAQAHHSHPFFYDQCKRVTIEGRVESAQWKNPHVLIVLKMDDGTTKVFGNAVRMMSLHGSKGLEFAYVFVIGVEEGVLPHEASMEEG